jgi:hypothetical protein
MWVIEVIIDGALHLLAERRPALVLGILLVGVVGLIAFWRWMT